MTKDLTSSVALAYLFAPVIGVTAIWWAIPVGWLIADLTGILLLKKYRIHFFIK